MSQTKEKPLRKEKRYREYFIGFSRNILLSGKHKNLRFEHVDS
jgi:hypothetical protein